MLRFILGLFILTLFLDTNLFAQQLTDVVIGKNDTLHSQILNQDRPIQIYLPDDYSTSNENYPLMILCDGHWNFIHTTGIVGFMSGNDVIPNTIMVGIIHENRDDDLVPETKQSNNYSGKADIFLDFLEKELIPYIESNYRISPFRILTGISYGGLFTNYTLITRPNLFDAYISVDPSLWWDHQQLINKSEKYFKNLERFDKILYFTQSEIKEMGSDVFARMLQRSAPKGLKWKFKHMHLETHGSIVHRSIYDGLEFIFSDWSDQPAIVNPYGRVFMKGDSVTVYISHEKSRKIHYTLDGSEPNETSPIYEKPLLIKNSVTLKTKPFLGYKLWGKTDSAKYNIAVLQEAEKNVDDLQPGLTYKYYEGDWEKLPDFKKITPKSEGIAELINIDKALAKDQFALVFNGYIDITEKGIYTFFLASDDGSRLKIGNSEVINFDGLHGVEERSGQIYLAPGKHKISVEFFEKGGGEFLGVGYEGPEIEKKELPLEVLVH